jgi:hypothetical protein
MIELYESGLRTITPKAGQQFDPKFMETTGMVPTGDLEQDLIVQEVVKSGYLWKETVLLPARIKISKRVENKSLQPDVEGSGDTTRKERKKAGSFSSKAPIED